MRSTVTSAAVRKPTALAVTSTIAAASTTGARSTQQIPCRNSAHHLEREFDRQPGLAAAAGADDADDAVESDQLDQCREIGVATDERGVRHGQQRGGRLPGAQRRKRGVGAGGVNLPDPHRGRDAADVMGAEVAQFDGAVQRRSGDLDGGRRREDLARMTGTKQSSTPLCDCRRNEVVRIGLPGVDRDADRRAVLVLRSRCRGLQFDGGAQRIGRTREDCEAGLGVCPVAEAAEIAPHHAHDR